MPEAAQAVHVPEHLLCAARELMAEVSFGAMSMRQLAARAGLQPGSLYHHVASKQDLLLDVLLDTLAQRLAAWQQGPFARNLRGYLQFLLSRQQSHPYETLLLRHEARHVNPGQRIWLEQAIAHSQAPLRDIIKRGQKRGRFHVGDIASVTEGILALVETADGMRQRAIPVEESWIETWIMQMSLALLSPPTPCR